MQSAVRYRLMLVSAALLFSTGGAALKAATLTGWQVASFRSLAAALVMLAAIPAARRGWNRSVLLVSLAYAATLVLFALANRLTTSANAIILQSTAPFYMLLLGPWILREPVRRNDIFFMAGIAIALGLFLLGRDTAVATATNPPLGNALALASGVAYALLLAGLRWLGRGKQGDSAVATVAAGNLIAFAAALPLALPVTRAQPMDAAVIFYLGAIQIGLAYWCLTAGIRHVPVFEATALLQVEPAMNPVWTWFLHHEAPNAWSIAAGAVIISATLVNANLSTRK